MTRTGDASTYITSDGDKPDTGALIKGIGSSDCRGLAKAAKPAGSQVGSAGVRVWVHLFQPSLYPDPGHGLAVTHDKTRPQNLARLAIGQSAY